MLTRVMIMPKFALILNIGMEGWWPHGHGGRLRRERTVFQPWPGTLCCVVAWDTLLSQFLFTLFTQVYKLMGYGERNAGDNLAMDWHHIKGGVFFLLSLRLVHDTETAICCRLNCQLVPMQT